MAGLPPPDHSVNATCLQCPPQSADGPGPLRRALPPRSALSPSQGQPSRHHRKRGKSVRWDPTIVDNEHKMKSGSPKPSTAGNPSTSSGSSAKSSRLPASSRLPKAIAPLKADPVVTRQHANHTSVQIHRPLSPLPPQSSHSKPNGPVGANSASKMVPASKVASPTNTKKVPPAVPDAPIARGPPPAPIPARLPTPDLPEIKESEFFLSKDTLLDLFDSFEALTGRNDSRRRPVIQKTDDQLDSAMAYIQDRKRRG